MQVSVETTEGLERQMKITVPAANIEKVVTAELRKIAKTRRFDGFRKGKVPMKLVERMHGHSVRSSVLGEVMQNSFFEAITKEKITPAGMPTITPIAAAPGADLVFNATFEVYPEVELADFSAIKVEKPVVNVQESDIDEMLETLRKQQATWTKTDAAAVADSRVVIDFVGFVDGEEFEGGKSEDFNLDMGANRMIPGFEDGIVGKKAGDNVTVEVTFPEEYHVDTLKGKPAKFDITVKQVEERVLPELNDEFIKLFGVTEGGLDAFKAEIRKNMQRELKATVTTNIKEQVIDGLVETNAVDVPKAAVDSEIEDMKRQALQRFASQLPKGQELPKDQMPELPREMFAEQAERRVKVGILLGEVIKSQELKVTDEDAKAIIAEMASAYEDPSEVIKYYEGNEKLMASMRNRALEEQAIDAVLATAKVSDKEVSFNELMDKAK